MAENTRVDRAFQAVLVILADRVHRNELKGLGEPSRVRRQETRRLIVGVGGEWNRWGLGNAQRWGKVPRQGRAGLPRCQMAQLVSSIHQNPEELGSNGSEGVNFPARVGSSMKNFLLP